MGHITHLKLVLNGIHKMKWLLLLLALQLVTSDKLDRTYIPPPGAKYSGGTLNDLHLPLEVPKETYTGAILDGPSNLNNGIFTAPKDYLPSTFSNTLNDHAGYPTNVYQLPKPSSDPIISYGSFPPKSPSSGYLPSKQLNAGTQSYPDPNINPEFGGISAINSFRPDYNQYQKDNSNYYYVPTMPTYNNGIMSQIPNDKTPILGHNQIPNQVNNGYIPGQSYIPTTMANGIVQNYQPSAFGYYGGNPMIMTSQNSSPKDFENIELATGLERNDNSSPMFTINQEELKNGNKILIKPFQTPLVRLNSKNPLKPADKDTTTAPNTLPSQFPTTRPTSFGNENAPTNFNQRSRNPVRPRFRQERPQTESERNAIIINYENSISPESYSYSYDTSNGIHVDESGTANNGVRAKGSYSYTGDDGKIYTVTYTADENGFQPRGDHLPTAPPIPEAIQKVIDQATKNKATGIIDDGSYDERKYGHMNYLGAMDRYNLFNKSNGKVSRFNDGKRKQSGLLPNKNKDVLNNIPLYDNNDKKIYSQVLETPKNLQNLINNDANKVYIQDNELNGKKSENTETRSRFKLPDVLDRSSSNNTKNNNKKPFNNENGRPITFITESPITSEERVMFQTHNPNAKHKQIKQDQMNQKQIPGTSSGVTFTDDGYYYVPPIIKFNPFAETPASENNSYLTTSKPNKKITSTEANRRTGFDEPQREINFNEEGSSTRTPINPNTVATEPTRQPYISGPDDRDKKSYDNSQPMVFDQNDRARDFTNPNDQDLSLYGFNTTPMTTQTIQETQPLLVYPQYYQSTTNPIAFDQTQPNAVVNKVNIPLTNKGITVSQDFVSTTYRPTISGDGVLEVNQNVKIYGIGRPEVTTANNGYLYNVPDSNKNVYSTTIPNGEPTIPTVYPNNFYSGPVQDSAALQGIPSENLPYGYDYPTTGIPGTNFDKITGPYSNVVFERVPQGDPSIATNAPIFVANTFENPEVTTRANLATMIANQNPAIGIIGEDFNGPKQPQTFDPATGYYYK